MASLQVGTSLLLFATWSLLLLTPPAIQGQPRALGPSIPGPVSSASTDCEGPLTSHHDGAFEGGIAWHYLGQAPPYYGAFGESFALGAGSITCLATWITQNGQTFGDPADLYVWEGGSEGPPGDVIAMRPNVTFEDIPVFPAIGLYVNELVAEVDGDFTVGWWGNWPGFLESYFVAADLDGPVGKPWTCVAPDIGYPSGWQDPGPLFGLSISSLGIGVSFVPDAPVGIQSVSWSRVKSLYLR